LLNAVAVVINGTYAGSPVRNGPLQFVHSQNIYRFATLDALAQYMIAQTYAAVAPKANHPAPNLTFDNEHGVLHFGGDPTDTKSKWSLTQADARTLMETEINKYLRRFRVESRKSGWELWYVGGQATNDIGRYFVRGVRGGKPTKLFTIQAQVNLLE